MIETSTTGRSRIAALLTLDLLFVAVIIAIVSTPWIFTNDVRGHEFRASGATSAQLSFI